MKIFLLFFLLLAPAKAFAVDVALNVGVIDAIGVPGGSHAGFYPSLGLSLAFPLKKVTLIPSLSVEVAPESGRWGFVGAFVTDFPLNSWFGVDLDVTLIHDQPGANWAASEFLLGAGVGCSFFFGNAALSPFLNLFRDLTVAGWFVVPGINLATTF